MKTILLDIDGVIANFDAALLDVLKYIHNIDIDLMKLKSWDIFDIPEVRVLENDIFRCIEMSRAIYNMDLYDGAIEFVDTLRIMGRVIACTASIYPTTFPSERAAWLIGKVGFNVNDIIFAKDKSMVKGDVFIDDNLSNIINWGAENPSSLALHFQTPFRNVIPTQALPGNVNSCTDYKDALEQIKRKFK